MIVRDVMSSEVVTVPVDATLRQAVYRLLDERVGSVVVVDEETPMGLVTEDLDVVGIVTLTDIVWHLSDIRQEIVSVGDQGWEPRD